MPTQQLIAEKPTKFSPHSKLIIKELKKRNFSLVNTIDTQKETIRNLERELALANPTGFDERQNSDKKLYRLSEYMKATVIHLLQDAPKIRYVLNCLLQKIDVYGTVSA